MSHLYPDPPGIAGQSGGMISSFVVAIILIVMLATSVVYSYNSTYVVPSGSSLGHLAPTTPGGVSKPTPVKGAGGH